MQSALENNEGDVKTKGKTEKGSDLDSASCELGGSAVPASHAHAWDCTVEKMRILMERDPSPGLLLLLLLPSAFTWLYKQRPVLLPCPGHGRIRWQMEITAAVSTLNELEGC